jgi:hypothetical protein
VLLIMLLFQVPFNNPITERVGELVDSLQYRIISALKPRW